MTRVLLAADSGATMVCLTDAVATVRGSEIVRYGNSRTRLDRILGATRPDLVVLADLRTEEGALARLAEVRGTLPRAKVVVLSSSAEAGWLADALRADAAAVVPGRLEPRTLGIVLREVLDEPESVLATSTVRKSGQRRRGARIAARGLGSNREVHVTGRKRTTRAGVAA
jgi:DNA-binding NarL/FixJ family response regulator